ncbi:MAG: DUF2784 domain-containing protein [Acidobacteria bacterium]|nr:MAG: DUF2784 domain-containing protein [Acidobacteriota bacterium]
MCTVLLASNFYAALAIAVLFLHGLFILWVIFGAFLVRARPMFRWLHISSLIWGILTELLPWSCPLTVLENWLEGRAGIEPYQGGFLLHYLDRLVYPDISATVLTVAGVFVCVLNLALYARQIWSAVSRSAK